MTELNLMHCSRATSKAIQFGITELHRSIQVAIPLHESYPANKKNNPGWDNSNKVVLYSEDSNVGGLSNLYDK